MPEPTRSQQDLTVKGESIERIYGNYEAKRYIVNRRYQRKLVWTLDEKVKFIDSIVNGYPVPIVLLAEMKSDITNNFEIIDGMQRLNAITGFLENEFSVGGQYFDLNTMAETKAKLDHGVLSQKLPILPRNLCVTIASYTIPLSIYEFSKPQEVDEVFRRINSGGRKLSRQELRTAGATGHFAQAVRLIASKVRGDVSASDILVLNDMKKISITNRELDYGIPVDDILWIKNGVLTKEQVRESRDEEITADLLAYMLLDSKPPSRREYLDDYFGFSDDEGSSTRLEQIELATQKMTIESATNDFQRVLDQLKLTLTLSGVTLGQLLFGVQPPRAPRYFQVVFLALHKLMITQNMEVKDQEQLIHLIQGSGESITIPEGGRWGAEDRENMVNATAGRFSPAFQASKSYDPAQVRWITQLENLFRQSYTEQAAYDFKQGFVRLDGSNAFDEGNFEKIIQTMVAIANIKQGVKGYVIIGVTDTSSDAKRIFDLYGVNYTPFERFCITGVEHEAKALGKTLDQYFQLIIGKIRTSQISDSLREYITRNVKLVRYFDKSLFVLESQAQTDPSSYGGAFYERHGTEVRIVPTEKFAELFRRFHAGL